MNNVISKHKDKTSENEGKNQEIQRSQPTFRIRVYDKILNLKLINEIMYI